MGRRRPAAAAYLVFLLAASLKTDAAVSGAGPFSFIFDETGLLRELNVSTAAGGSRRVVWDERGRYGAAFVQHWPHSGGGGWIVRTGASADHSCSGSQIRTTRLSHPGSSSVVQVRSACDALTVVDSFDFSSSEPMINWTFTVRNALSVDAEILLPVTVGGLQLGDVSPPHGLNLSDTRLHRLRPEAGGRLELPWFQTANYLNYPGSLNIFSPLALIGENEDDGMTVAMTWMSDLELPTNVTFKELPRNQFSPVMTQSLGVRLRAGESRSFSVAIVVAVSGSVDARWRRAVAPYKALLERRHGTKPQYCPPGPTAYLVAENAASSPIVLDKSKKNYHRYKAGSKYAEVFSADTAPAQMAAAGVDLFGVWQTAVYSPLVTSDGSSAEFMPNIDLVAPNLDAGPNRSVLNAFTQTFTEAGVTPFHFARPCLEVKGAGIEYSAAGPQFKKGVITKSDLTAAGGGAAERYLARMADFVERGFGGFYFDAMSCPGDTAFLQQVVERWPHLFLMKEGCRDRDAYLWPQIPILKLPHWPENNSLLIKVRNAHISQSPIFLPQRIDDLPRQARDRGNLAISRRKPRGGNTAFRRSCARWAHTTVAPSTPRSLTASSARH
jgi:hypothetical protein